MKLQQGAFGFSSMAILQETHMRAAVSRSAWGAFGGDVLMLLTTRTAATSFCRDQSQTVTGAALLHGIL